MGTAQRFDQLSAQLRSAVEGHEHLSGLVLLGSAAEQARSRRDEWSDHDFFAIAKPGRGTSVRGDLSWLPAPTELAATAREGEIGFVALYDDGHVFEFALAQIDELSGAIVEEADVVSDDDGRLGELVGHARDRARAINAPDTRNETTLVFLKLLIGVGRARRGEILTAGQFVRTWAVQCLVRAVRARAAADAGESRTAAIDPMRRFEDDHPALAARIAVALERPVEEAARMLYDLTRETLEPGWEGFPRRAADAVAARLGWKQTPSTR